MDFVHASVEHIGFDRAPNVVEGDPISHVLAVGDAGFTAGRAKGIFQALGGLDRLIQVIWGDYKALI